MDQSESNNAPKYTPGTASFPGNGGVPPDQQPKARVYFDMDGKLRTGGYAYDKDFNEDKLREAADKAAASGETAANTDEVRRQMQRMSAEREEQRKNNGQAPLEYLVRGAVLKCQYGSHERKLNLPKCHGVYIFEQPAVHRLDFLPGDTRNIPSFGVCRCKNNTSNEGDVCLKTKSIKRQDGREIEVEGEVEGKCCVPIITNPWFATNPDTLITEDAACSIPTEDSFLICNYGAYIEVKDSGQVKPEAAAAEKKRAEELKKQAQKKENEEVGMKAIYQLIRHTFYDGLYKLGTYNK